MSGASRFIILLSSPLRPSLLPLRHLSALPRHLSTFSRRSILSSSTPFSAQHLSPLPVKSSHQRHLHSQTANGDFSLYSPSSTHPWPEWSHLISRLTASQQRSHGAEMGELHPEDGFVAFEELSEDFVRAASACLAFAREHPNLIGSLARRDIEVIVSNGTPFLFRTALQTARRMRALLGLEGSHVEDFERANTVDLMKYILSYASNPSVASERNTPYSWGLIESSARKRLHQLTDVSFRAPATGMSASGQYQFSDGIGQTLDPQGQNVTMKRGDWICPKCNFMNFARNRKCLECEESRPKRQLSGGEWECPQCDFFNYARNLVCLRCDCKRPVEATTNSFDSRPDTVYNVNCAYRTNMDSRLAENEEKAQRWFSKISQPSNDADSSGAAADEDFPEIMPLRRGENRFVVSTRKTPLERRLASPQYQRNVGNNGNPESTKTFDTSISQSLDHILNRSSYVSGTNDKDIAAKQNAAFERQPSGSNSTYVPFVPLPADMFTKKDENVTDDSEKVVTEPSNCVSNDINYGTSSVGRSDEFGKTFQDDSFLSGITVTQSGSQDKEKEQADKTERWFKRVAELHDVKDLPSAISDDDFPEIMPMRKGENRFVVSKKKDRSLTSPMYKRQMAMEQANNKKFVPFVPFPPGYFAKETKSSDGVNSSNPTSETCSSSTPQADGSVSPVEPLGESSSNSTCKSMHPEKMDDACRSSADNNSIQGMVIRHDSSVGSNSKDSSYSSCFGGMPAQTYSNSQAPSSDTGNTGYSWKVDSSHSASSTGSPVRPPENQNVGSGWTGKSLEGSAVKEPDPLDMSEEAKAERWFRRVAQIKDISELSQIPDEDFPSIMPMRKGVNRFVVSKRKTPLERRLSSPQYRRNLPVVTSDPVKKESDNSDGK